MSITTRFPENPPEVHAVGTGHRPWFRIVVLLFSLALLCGCAATGPKYSENQSAMPALDSGSARIFFFRKSRFMSSLSDAEIHINDDKVGECANGAYFYTDTKPGSIRIMADNTGTPGTHEISKTVKGGREYYFEVLVNEEYVNAGAILGILGQLAFVKNYPNSSGWTFHEVRKKEAVPLMQELTFSMDGE